MSGRFTEECEIFELERKIDDLENEVENLKYNLSELEYERDKIADSNDGLYDKLDALNDENHELTDLCDSYRESGRDMVDIMIYNLRGILDHLDEHHPEIIFELLSVPDVCPDIDLQQLLGPGDRAEYNRDLYTRLMADLKT